LTSDVYTHQVLPQRLPGWETDMQRVGDIRMNWPTAMSYNLLHDLMQPFYGEQGLNVGKDW